MKRSIAQATAMRFLRLLLVSFLGSATTAFTVYQQQMFLPSGELNYKPAMGAASTAFLVSFAGSVLHGLELLCSGISGRDTPPIVPPSSNSKVKDQSS